MVLRMMTLGLIAALGACTPADPRQQQADAIEKSADTQADGIRAEAATRADALSNQATQLSAEATRAGGFQGETLEARAEALRKESGIIKRQAEAQADAVETSGEAKSKTLTSQ